MTQRSRPQADNNSTLIYTDSGPYSRDQWAQRMRAAHTGDTNTASSRTRIRGVVPTYDNLLVTTISGTDVVVGTGAGMVFGTYLFNDATVTFSPPAAAANTHIDLVCLVENNTNAAVATDSAGNTWTFPNDLTDYNALNSVPAYTARLVIISGADNVAPVAPTLDQLTTLYCVPIAQYTISTVPAISAFTDRREFVDVETIVGVATGDNDDIEEAAIIGTQVTNGIGANGLGVAIRAKLENSTGDLENAGQMAFRWTDATNASEDSRWELRLAAGNADNLSAVINAPTTASADGNARGAGAVDLQQFRALVTQVASGSYATIQGGASNTASGDYSNASCFTCTASGDYSHAEGNITIASGDYSHAEGSGTTASGTSGHAEGSSTLASGDVAHAEGSTTRATGDYTHSGGRFSLASKPAQFARASTGFDPLNPGTAQYSDYHLARSITHGDANWYEIYLGTFAAQLTIATDQVMTFDVLIVGTTQGCTKSFSFRIVGIIENDGGTTSILASTVTTIYDTDDVSFDARATADDPNDALLIEVSDSDGAGDVVRWSAVVRTAEVTFPA